MITSRAAPVHQYPTVREFVTPSPLTVGRESSRVLGVFTTVDALRALHKQLEQS